MSKLWLLAGVLLLTGCGKEVGRVPFASEGSSGSSLVLEAGRVAFWTDIDIEYDGPATLAYQVALFQRGKQVATAVCNPLGDISTKLLWVEAQHGSARSRSGLGKLDCSATLASGGPTTVEATLAFSVRPSMLTLNRADLVVKQ